MICPVCRGDSYETWGGVNGYSIEQCCTCGLGITTPFPEQEAQALVNTETYAVNNRIAAYKSRQQFFQDRYVRQLDDIGRYKSSGRLLDIGCNIGMFLSEAKRAGYSVTGVELNRDCAEYARNIFGIEVHSDVLESISFPARFFDVVTMYDVLEHIADMKSILLEIERILVPGGLLVVQSPNVASFMAEITGASWSWLSPPDHLYHFTPGSLSMLLTQNGYTIQQLKTWEPADDFCNDVMQARLGDSLLARVIRKLIRLSGIARILVSLVQPLWWRKQRGGLVEAYAIKL